MSANALEIRGLKKSFKTFTLGPMDLTVPMGAIYGFVGPNGSGKTTTIDMIFGLGEKDGGSITVARHGSQARRTRREARTGYVSPELNYVPWTRVRKIISFVKGFYPTWDDEYCNQLLESLRISREERIQTLSFGARIKLSLILALSWRPTLLVLDEPTVGLDAISKQQVFAELLSAVQGEDRAVFISSHGITDLERFADHVGMIKNGRMLFEGPTVDVVDVIGWSTCPRSRRSVSKDSRAFWSTSVSPAGGGCFLTPSHTCRSPAQMGLTPLSDSPVSLEELFVALGSH